MSLALIEHREATNVGGGAVGTVVAAFNKRKLTHMPTNDQFNATDLTVDVFRPSSAGATGSQFDLKPGTYRICASVLFSSEAAATPVAEVGSVCQLYNVTDAHAEYHTGTTDPIISLAAIYEHCAKVSSNSINRNYSNKVCYIDTEFVVTGLTKTFELRQAYFFNAAGAATALNSAGKPTTATLGAYDNVYASIKLTRIL